MPTITFTSSGSWTALASVVDCQTWGEGGNGGNAVKNSHSGGGGGGGEYAEETALAVTGVISFTIGAGGTGTATSFPGTSVTVTANAGGNGSGLSSGAGGTGSANSIHNSGGHGGNGASGTGIKPGGGGGGSAGAGGAGGAGGSSGGTAGAGSPPGAAGGGGNSPGTAPGGAGGGGSSSTTVGNLGAAGAAGQITIIYTASTSGTATLAGTGTLTASGSSFNPSIPGGQIIQPGLTWARRFARERHQVPWGPQIQTVTGTATLPGTGTMVSVGGLPNPTIANQWANSYGQGTTFTSITSALQSCVVGLNPGNSVGPGSGVPAPGNWLFTIASWTQNPQIINVHVGVGDDGHSWWREFPASSTAGLTRTSVSYTPNITSQVQDVYVAPDGEIAAINVLVIEVAGLGPWDSLSGTSTGYTAAGTSVSLALGAPAKASFILAATGGDNVSSGQAFLPSGWLPLVTQTQTNGVNALADNILTAAYLPSTTGSVSVSGTSSSSEDMSGFILSVQVSGNNPVPAGQNPDWPHMVFEAGLGAGFNTPDSEITWTDLTTRLWDWEETTGIQFQLGQIQATNLTMHLDDFDGNLIPTNTASPYYPNVQPGTPVRLRAAIGTMGAVSVNRWYVIQRNATQWGEGIDETFRRWCPVSGTDLWAALSSVPPTFYRSEVYEDAPYAWWPCDDQPGTSGVLPTFLLNAALGNANPLNILLSPNGGAVQQFFTRSGFNLAATAPPGIATYTVGANAGWMYGDPQSSPASISEAGNSVTATPGSASWQATGQAGSTGSFGWYLSCNDANFPPLSGGITVEVWFNYPFYGTGNGFAVSTTESPRDDVTWSAVLQQPYNTPFTILELATAAAPVAVLQLDTSGHLNLITYNGGSGTSHSIYTASDLRSGSWHMITMTLTTSAWEIWLDGGVNAHASGSGAGMTSAWTWLIGNADFGTGGGVNTSQIVHGGNVSLSHIAVYPYVLPYYRVLDHYWAAVTAFGQLPAPSGVQVQWVPQIIVSGTLNDLTFPSPVQTYAPDGTPVPLTYLGTANFYGGNNGVSASAIVTANAPGVTSGISAQATGADAQITAFDIGAGELVPSTFLLWVGWTGLAPSFNVYTGNTTGTNHEAAVVNGDGMSFTAGYGNTATVTGVCQIAAGDGSVPPTAASSIGDTVGQRIERLMRAGRVTSPNRCIDPAPLLVQAPGTTGGGQQVGASVQAIQQSDSGLLYVDNQNNLTYWQRPHLASQYSAPVWQLGPTSPRIPYYREIEWVTDPQHVYNAITIAPLSPTGASLPLITPSDVTDVEASQLRYGAQPLQVVSWLQSITEMQAQANWLFANFGTPMRHVEKVKVDASAANPATLAASWELVMGVNCGDIVTCEDWVIGGGGAVYTYRVTEVTRTITMGSGDNPATTGSIELILSPEPTSYWG